MRMLALLLIILLLTTTVPAQSDLFDRLQAANSAYEQGDYSTAITGYEAVIADRFQNADIYFNLGNAYYESGQLGSALLNFRRAQRLAPRDTAISTNIALVRAERMDFQPGETSAIDRLAVSTQRFSTLSELGWMVLSLWSLWFGLFAIGVFYRKWWGYLRWPLVGIGIGLLVGLGLFSARLYVTYNRPVAVVTDLSTQVRSGPGEEYVPIFQLFTAAELRVLETRGDWARFVLPDSRQGWVHREAIQAV